MDIDIEKEMRKLSEQVEGVKKQPSLDYQKFTTGIPKTQERTIIGGDFYSIPSSMGSNFNKSFPQSPYKQLRVKKGIKLDQGLGYKEDQVFNLVSWSPFLVMNNMGQAIEDADPADFELIN